MRIPAEAAAVLRLVWEAVVHSLLRAHSRPVLRPSWHSSLDPNRTCSLLRLSSSISASRPQRDLPIVVLTPYRLLLLLRFLVDHYCSELCFRPMEQVSVLPEQVARLQ